MSERLKFEHHLDADQIGAFVEQALPEHEREQLLEHLAVCAECRTIVALSLPEAEELAVRLPTAARRPWWAGWALAWPVAGAVAAIALYFAYVHRAAPAPNAPAQGQVAVAHLPVTPGPSQQEAAAAANPALRGSPVRQIDKSLAASSGSATGGAQRTPGAVYGTAGIGGPIVTGRDAAELIKPAPLPPPEDNALKSNESGAASADSASVSANNAMPAASAEASPAVVGSLQEKARTRSEAMALRAAPAPALAAPQAAGANTATVASAAKEPMDTVSANLAGMGIAQDEATAQPAPLKHPLPSHLPALSAAAQGSFVVAIDTRSAVFASNDGGKHWKAVHAQWQGRAVKAALVEPPQGSMTSISPAGVGAFQAYKKAPPRAVVDSLTGQASAPSVRGSSLSGTVTDQSGAAIPGATVIVTEIATGTAHTVQTDGAGHYLVDGLTTGTYRVEARAYGFKEQTISGAAVAGAGKSVANLALTVAASTQTVTVTGKDAEIPVAGKNVAKARSPIQTAPIFEITTDNGERWMSTGGLTWKRIVPAP